jgi:hypothetical protein
MITLDEPLLVYKRINTQAKNLWDLPMPSAGKEPPKRLVIAGTLGKVKHQMLIAESAGAR